MPIYSEGPFRQWTAVHWPSFVIKYEIQQNTAASRNAKFIARKNGQLVEVAASAFQRILTGKQSGVSVDFRSVPFGSPVTVQATTPDCATLVTSGQLYTYPDGVLITGAAPFKGVSIATSLITHATIICAASAQLSEDETSCLFHANAPALDAFIDDEVIIASDEPLPE